MIRRNLGSVVAAIAVLGLAACGGKTTTYKVPSESMVPTYKVGQHIKVDNDAYKDDKPEVGDLVIAHPPKDATSMTCGVEHPAKSMCPKPESFRIVRTVLQAAS